MMVNYEHKGGEVVQNLYVVVAPVIVECRGKRVGAVEIYYLKKKHLLYEGPILKEERLL